MKVKINKDACIGCGACTATVPDVFKFSDEGIAYVKVEEVPEDKKNEVIEASENCPTSAIEVEN